ncbi:MAG: hypothetical protein ACJA13_000275 [Paraglaciecola sp.]|jgi:hypothetical protein
MIMDKKMFKKMLVRKFGLGLIVCGVSLFSAQSQGAVIASFDAQVNVEVSSTFLSNEFETVLCCGGVYLEGNASGDASGTGDTAPVASGPGVVGTLSAAANGEVTGLGDYVDGLWATDGYLLIDNESGANPITGDVTFDIFLSANIFTDSLHSEAYAGAFIYIENSFSDVIFREFIAFDSYFDGPGQLGAQDTWAVNITDLTIAARDFETYYIAIQAIGFAEVPEPGGVFLAGLALLLAVRNRRTSLQPMSTRCI